jgi:hypothetical protein
MNCAVVLHKGPILKQADAISLALRGLVCLSSLNEAGTLSQRRNPPRPNLGILGSRWIGISSSAAQCLARV